LRCRSPGRISVSNFFVRRLLRLYPLMVVAPLVFIIVFYPNVDLATAFA
jgi:peptidoglycan/LPS O-acetylase OafA/YrhL